MCIVKLTDKDGDTVSLVGPFKSRHTASLWIKENTPSLNGLALAAEAVNLDTPKSMAAELQEILEEQAEHAGTLAGMRMAKGA
jgi:hypothetical protein